MSISILMTYSLYLVTTSVYSLALCLMRLPIAFLLHLKDCINRIRVFSLYLDLIGAKLNAASSLKQLLFWLLLYKKVSILSLCSLIVVENIKTCVRNNARKEINAIIRCISQNTNSFAIIQLSFKDRENTHIKIIITCTEF